MHALAARSAAYGAESDDYGGPYEDAAAPVSRNGRGGAGGRWMEREAGRDAYAEPGDRRHSTGGRWGERAEDEDAYEEPPYTARSGRGGARHGRDRRASSGAYAHEPAGGKRGGGGGGGRGGGGGGGGGRWRDTDRDRDAEWDEDRDRGVHMDSYDEPYRESRRERYADSRASRRWR